LVIFGADIMNLDGLQNITEVGNLVISSNSALTNLDGLQNINTGGIPELQVTDNAALNEFCGLKPLLDAGIVVIGFTIINGNASDPTVNDI
jgi:hypothetical protein